MVLETIEDIHKFQAKQTVLVVVFKAKTVYIRFLSQ